MRTVQIAELKNKLSAYLNFVRAGEEVLVRDRATPIARIVPLNAQDLDEDEMSSVAAGVLKLPQKPFDADAFFAGEEASTGPIPSRVQINRAMQWVRGGTDARVLGRKLRASAGRSRTKK